MTRHYKSFTVPTKVGFRSLVTLQHVGSIETNKSALTYQLVTSLTFLSPTVDRYDPIFDQIIQVHGGPKGDVCLGKLKCHHYICISCFSDVKFHSKCQIWHKASKERYKIRILIAKFELNSSKIEFQKFLKK